MSTAVRYVLITFIGLLYLKAYSQSKNFGVTELKVLARPSMDSIVLRWSSMDFAMWLKGNQYGYSVERYTIIRDKKVLAKPEKRILTHTVLRPRPLDGWESLVKRSKYGAIAAQALYGGSFQLTTQGSDVFQIVNKVKENEQRYAIALLAADLSAEVSTFLGLRFADKEVRKGEKYLYRVVCIPQPGDTLRGSVYVEAEDYKLPEPVEFTADTKDNLVSMKWNPSYYYGTYTAFIVERSENGKDFKSISQDPLITMTGQEGSRYQYATDSLPDKTKQYYYRLRGLSPFGESGPPSKAVSAKSTIEVNEAPHIIQGISEDNKTLKIDWEFPVKLNDGLKGFQIRRTEKPSQPGKVVNGELLSKQLRSFTDINPQNTNYYQVVALTLNGKEFKSPVYYAQLIDSIPPAAPTGLSGKVNESGKITLSWKANPEPDLYGYRIYRGNFKSEEFFQVTMKPLQTISFLDSVNLKTLNREIHYQITAIDKRQNQSALSAILTLQLPDKVKPVPPLFLPVTSSREGVNLQWTRSSSDDVSRYDLYRREGQVWKKITTQIQTNDSSYQFTDRTSLEGKSSVYTVVAVDQSDLESDPASPVSGTKILNPIKPAVVLGNVDVDRVNKKITLKWNYDQPEVNQYQIYRAREGQPLKLLSTINSELKSFEDKQLNINSIYTYRIIALFASGAKSAFSKEVTVNY